MNDVSSNQERSSERRALMIFSRWWVYVTIIVGVTGIFLEFCDHEFSDSFYQLSVYFLLPSAIIRNLIRVYIKIEHKNFDQLLLLIVPVLIFLFLIIYP